MIYARLFGGLGNQLFQYAAGRAVAVRLRTELILDARLAPPGNHWAYALDNFMIKASIGTDDELPPSKDRRLAYGLWRFFGRDPAFLRERGLGVNSAVLYAPDNTYLHGYFQSEAYFKDIEEDLRAELDFAHPPDTDNASWIEEIRAKPSVSVHLRRGDYVSSGKGAATHATCDQAFYDRAVAAVAETSGQDLRVFVFSDDPAWAKENLSFPFETRVAGHNGTDKGHEDMRLISQCTHNVIANSTFSWWGAWLNKNPDKIVVGPKRWFSNDALQNPDIVPESWLRV